MSFDTLPQVTDSGAEPNGIMSQKSDSRITIGAQEAANSFGYLTVIDGERGYHAVTLPALRLAADRANIRLGSKHLVIPRKRYAENRAQIPVLPLFWVNPSAICAAFFGVRPSPLPVLPSKAYTVFGAPLTIIGFAVLTVSVGHSHVL